MYTASTQAERSSIDDAAQDVELQRLVSEDGRSSVDSDDKHRHNHDPQLPAIQAPDEETWRPPPGFMWMQVAIMTNVFLNGFDGTITAATYAVISSEFDAANTASWLTTSYLITAAAFQPLYGRVSDIFGRRVCFFVSTVTFAVGCLGCGMAPTSLLLNIMRALAGVGGAGLMTMGKLNVAIAFVSIECRACTDILFSHNYQFRHDPLSPPRHVPSYAKRRLRLRRHLRRCLWRCHSRYHRVALVLSCSSSAFKHGAVLWPSCLA